MSENNILYNISENQAHLICEYFGKDYHNLEECEICELLDKLINSIVDIGELEPLN